MASISLGSSTGHVRGDEAGCGAAGGLLVLNEARRRLGSFQVCGLCTCCGGPRNICVPSPCCYALNCNIPNRPFGVCALTPRTCSCFGCSI
ncbi:unnamed protein product [Spirodela intermedia]|uniref:DUF7866 domain-containing protein n=1 Tax=Spirodela intermedia TaxID=51605 RepID=A0A7I8JDD7_SPIIN|nr:unnamed protein product [Spirodela intermedia]CAA6668166.1 unnamed protein product [Spirodela intermedia]